MKIRADLEGVVLVQVNDVEHVVLAAGDEVPDGVTVGDHLIDADEPAEVDEPDEADKSAAAGPYAKRRRS